jgi:hypothetical protein
MPGSRKRNAFEDDAFKLPGFRSNDPRLAPSVMRETGGQLMEQCPVPSAAPDGQSLDSYFDSTLT